MLDKGKRHKCHECHRDEPKTKRGNIMQHLFRGKRAAFLKAIRVTFAIAPAADQVGVNRVTIYRWMEADPAFAEAVADARRACVEDIEARHVEAAKGKCVI